VVILGLIGLTLARYVHGLDWLSKADSIAALVVALIVIFISAELGYRTVSALLDTAPKGLAEQVEAVAESIEGVVDAHAIRIRPSGAHTFIDMHVTMDGSRTLNDAHAATVEIEKAIHSIISPADITVHVEPVREAKARMTAKKAPSRKIVRK
jgi:divalent metal cation (Fe/Co/Zn/Cd) transporter